jgi:predicted Zn-ribbon and HTH transcriptional regulator
MVRNSRKKAAIINVLRAASEPMTAQQIFDKVTMKNAIKDARHISIILRGMTNVKKRLASAYSISNSYQVNTYYLDDEGAEV